MMTIREAFRDRFEEFAKTRSHTLDRCYVVIDDLDYLVLIDAIDKHIAEEKKELVSALKGCISLLDSQGLEYKSLRALIEKHKE